VKDAIAASPVDAKILLRRSCFVQICGPGFSIMTRACYGAVQGTLDAPLICHGLVQREANTRTTSGGMGVGEV
jgi:hypothetical protein